MIDVYQKLRVKVVAVWPSELDPVIFPADPKELHEIRIYQYLSEATPGVMKTIAASTGDWLFHWIIIVFTLLFLLLEGRMLTRRVVEIFGPSEEVRGKVGKVLREMARQVRTYLIWRTIINVALAIVIGLVFQIAGLSYPWAWAFLLLILNYVPYLGPILAGFPPFFDAVLSTNLTVALILSCFYWTIIILEGYLIVPLVMGKSMDLNATTVMLACLFWELIWGIPGLFLAMPLMAGIKAVLNNTPDWNAWANLMSASDEPPAPVEPDLLPPPSDPPPMNGDGKPDTSSLTNIHLGP
jgi:AI-2 transport protein TqsA